MKKIETPEEKERKRKRNTAILSVIMLFLLVFSTLGFAFLANPYSSNVQNEIPFNNQDSTTGRVALQYQGTNINLLSTLDEIQNISVEIEAIPETYAGKTLYINAKNQGILLEISSTLGKFARLQEACYGKCEENIPEKNCTDNLIVWKESAANKVYQQESCIFIEGDIRAADAFLYKLFSPNIKV